MSNKSDQKGKIFRRSFSALFFLLVFIQGAVAQKVDVVSPNGPLPCIVTTENKTDQDAAADLGNYLSRVSGQKIIVSETPATAGVIIHVGRDKFVKEKAPDIDSLFADGYILRCILSDQQYHLILAGKIEPSAQWAVEQFLEDYAGVRWLFPDPVYGEVVPARPTIMIDSALSKTYQPNYICRYDCGMTYRNPAAPGTWVGRLRPYVGYKGFTTFGNHAIQYIFNNGSSSGEVFAQHPEWFAFFNGKRQWWAYGNGWQIDTTNPETVQHAVKYVLDYFAKNPNSPVCSVGHNDGAGWCECPVCQNFRNSITPAYTTSEVWWSWVNQVAKEVAKTYPDKWVESMAYESSSLPPRFPLEKNVTVTKTIVYSTSSGIFAELKLADDWAKVCKSVNLYSYMWGASFMGFRHYPHAAKDFLKWGHEELGSLAHVTECYGDWTFDGPKYHYIMALQWDVNANPDEIMQDFCAQSYGLAAASMRKFWDRLEEVYERRGPTPYGEIKPRFLFYQWPSWRDDFYIQPNDEFREYTLADVQFLDDRIKEALSLAKDADAGVIFRMERMSEAWKYYRTALVSKLKFYDNPPATNVSSESEQEKTLATAREIADLRTERKVLLGKMRAYPQVNPRICKENYWGNLAALTIFNHEATLLDELCSAVTGYLEKTGGKEIALKFWQNLKPGDSLSESAQTQLYLLGQSKPINLLQNGGFESGDTKGWEIAANGCQVSISKEGAYQGNYSLRLEGGLLPTLSQKVPVSGQERYRLTAWIKYLTAPNPAYAVPAESGIEFYAGSKQIIDEPTRNILRTTSPSAGWIRLCSTVTIPPGADTALIKLRCTYNCATLLDEVVFEKIKAIPESKAGALADTFDGKSLDQEKWFQTSGSGGTIPPRIADGWLIYDDTAMYSITAYAKFNDLLKYAGEKRYRLRLHAARLSDDAKPVSFSWGLKTGTGPISISDSGLFWTYLFRSPEQPNAQLRCYAYQDSKLVYSDVRTLNRLNNANEVWYTFYFDPEYVTIYASANGYDESEASLVARYKHEIKDIAANGDVYLKMAGGSYKLDEITLTRP